MNPSPKLFFTLPRSGNIAQALWRFKEIFLAMYVAVLKDPSARDARISPLIHTRCDLPAELDDSRERPMDFDLFCATRDGP
jgi:hypothetical protein